MAGLLDYLEALGETGAMLGTGAVSGMAGMPYGVYKGITSGKYGTPEGVRIAEEEARKFIERNTYQPRSQIAQNAIGYAGGLLSDARIPPVMPEAAALSAIPLRPVARMAGEGVAATGRFVAPKAGQLAEQYMVRTGGILPLDVYHGSPHTFPPTPNNPLGEFDASKIGTGEGAQAYGHGIYVAEAPAVAKGYQEALSKRQFLTKNGFFDPSELEHLNVKVTASRGDLDKAIELAKKYGSPDSDYPDAAAKAARDLQKLEALKAAGGIKQNTGNLYKVDLPDEKIAQMLDFDKPLSQQSKQVKQAIEKTKAMLPSNALDDLGGDLSLMYGPNVMPVEFLNTWESLGQKAGGEIALQKFGIPGIKYLDEGSRSAGKGTRNFVVFPGEEKGMTILERNAQRADELKRLQAGGLLAP